MATLTQIRNKANTTLTQFWSLLQQKQTNYFARHGKYFQLLVTNRVVDGVDTTFELRHPTDERNVLDVDFSFNSTVPFQISVDEWIGEDIGYSASARIELLNGDIYRRTRDSLGNDTNWVQVTSET